MNSAAEIVRRDLIPDDVNSRIMNAMIRHRHYLFRVENGVIRDMVEPLADAVKDIEEMIRQLRPGMGLEPIIARRVRALERRRDDILGLITAGQQKSIDVLRDRLREITEREYAIQGNIFTKNTPPQLALQLSELDPTRIEAMITTPLGGARWEERMAKSLGEMSIQVQRALVTAVAVGEGAEDVGKRIAAAVQDIGMRRAVMIARTEIQRIANDTAMEFYRNNRHLIKAIQAVETLDDRTCLVCAFLDGKTWAVNDTSRPQWPIHPQCRGILVGVVRGAAELGIDPSLMPQAWRQSLSGAVPETTDYQTWFSGQPPRFQREVLGKTRYERFSRGELKLDQMVKDGRILRISELPEET